MHRWTVAASLVALLALFSLIGGTIGYVRAGSTISALVGGATCAVLIPCAYLLHKQRRGALYFSGTVALLLAGRFTLAYLQTPKFMPHILIISLSCAVLLSLFPLWLARSG